MGKKDHGDDKRKVAHSIPVARPNVNKGIRVPVGRDTSNKVFLDTVYRYPLRVSLFYHVMSSSIDKDNGSDPTEQQQKQKQHCYIIAKQERG